jgi:hypothetical protein
MWGRCPSMVSGAQTFSRAHEVVAPHPSKKRGVGWRGLPLCSRDGHFDSEQRALAIAVWFYFLVEDGRIRGR